MPFTDPSLGLLAKALAARAASLRADPAPLVAAVARAARVHGLDQVSADALGGALADVVAGEFAKLAEELHGL